MELNNRIVVRRFWTHLSHVQEKMFAVFVIHTHTHTHIYIYIYFNYVSLIPIPFTRIL